MRSGFRKRWDDLNLKIESAFRKRDYRKKAKLRLRRMGGGFDCRREYREIVLPYWKRYGYRPARYWYQIFSARDGQVDPRYIPDDLYYGELIPYFSNSLFRRFGEDKCYHALWVPGVKRPRTICQNVAGVYYDEALNPIPRERAMELALSFDGEFLLKPSIDSGEGRLIRFFSPSRLTRDDLEAAVRSIGANFLFQEAVKQHPILARLNPSSLNTIRAVTFFFEGEVRVLSRILRVGAPGARIDNIGAGGFACPIGPDGRLGSRAVNRKAEWVETTGQGVPFASVQIPSFDRVIEAVTRAHRRMAHFKLIGWDMTVDRAGDPVLIEFNTCPGSNQITCGPTFGDLTDCVLDEFFHKRSLANAQN